MEEAPLRDLRELAWFERNLAAGVSTIHLDDERLIVGDWDGGIHCWDLAVSYTHLTLPTIYSV